MASCHPRFSSLSSPLKQGRSNWIDHIFFSTNLMKVTKLLEQPLDEDVDWDGLPSTLFPSDHIRIEAQFEVYYDL
jgi:mRNA deadenylase 3'-5' endonuclease subunit Ccr4